MRVAAGLVLLLVAPLAFASAAGIVLDASAGDGVIHLEVASDAARSVRVVVVREDPVLGPVVDRVAPLELGASGSANVSLDGIRGGEDLTIRVLDAAVELPLVEDVANLVDAAKVLDLPDLASLAGVDVPHVSGGSRTLHAYPIAEGLNMGCTCHLATSPKGSVVASWLSVPNGSTTNAPSLVTVAVSLDGGHSFGEPRVLNSNATTWVSNFAIAERSGDIFVLFEESMPVGDGSATWSNTRLVRLDGATGATLSTSALPRGLQAFNLWGSAVTPEGAMLIAHTGTMAVGNESRPAVIVEEIRRDGRAGALGSVALPADAGFAGHIHVLADRTGRIALAYTEFANGKVHVRHSADGGRTFPIEHDLSALDALGLARTVHSASMDDTGTIHIASVIEFARVPAEGGGSWSNDSVAYVRVPLAGDASVLPLSGRHLPGALVPEGDWVEAPHLVVRGPRVWIVWNANARPGANGGGALLPTYAVESTTGGLTFGEPYHLRTAETTSIHMVHDMALLPDGRPILVAWHHHPAPLGLRLSVFPFFDPLAPVDGIEVRLEPEIATASPTSEAPTTATPVSMPDASSPAGPASAPVVDATPSVPVGGVADPTLDPSPPAATNDVASQREDPPSIEVPLPAWASFGALAVAVALASRRRA